MSNKTIPLVTVPRELASIAGKPVTGYRQLYAAVVDGYLPAEKRNGRWFVTLNDAAKLVGVKLPSVAA